ncbi:ribonuclease P protein subunit p38 [Erpetoichthys calabaricus]|uniref:ribonuclease P protein subunit p38 n=1 Tax=Erpetoichthys calabaricus TaxID=27687 RepID=UPI00223470A3|nr:ribonuclease P protein subunit p38 [Erpetoichthys calabaricus]
MSTKTPISVGKASGKAKTVQTKTSFNNPYNICWSPLERENMHYILEILQKRFKELGLQKKEPPTRKRRPRICTKGQKGDNKDPEEGSWDVMQEVPMESSEEEQHQGWSNLEVRKQLAIGINEVTRALEKDELGLVLVCKSVKPVHMTNHLIQLSCSRAVPACQVPRLSENVSALLCLKSVLALGFMRNSESFVNEINAIIPKVPPLKVPWLDQTTPQQDVVQKDPETPAKETVQCVAPDGDVKLHGSHKRKSDEVTGTKQDSDISQVTLHPLKIKRVVPNPAKIRKQKGNKKKK